MNLRCRSLCSVASWSLRRPSAFTAAAFSAGSVALDPCWSPAVLSSVSFCVPDPEGSATRRFFSGGCSCSDAGRDDFCFPSFSSCSDVFCAGSVGPSIDNLMVSQRRNGAAVVLLLLKVTSCITVDRLSQECEDRASVQFCLSSLSISEKCRWPHTDNCFAVFGQQQLESFGCCDDDYVRGSCARTCGLCGLGYNSLGLNGGKGCGSGIIHATKQQDATTARVEQPSSVEPRYIRHSKDGSLPQPKPRRKMPPVEAPRLHRTRLHDLETLRPTPDRGGPYQPPSPSETGFEAAGWLQWLAVFALGALFTKAVQRATGGHRGVYAGQHMHRTAECPSREGNSREEYGSRHTREVTYRRGAYRDEEDEQPRSRRRPPRLEETVNDAPTPPMGSLLRSSGRHATREKAPGLPAGLEKASSEVALDEASSTAPQSPTLSASSALSGAIAAVVSPLFTPSASGLAQKHRDSSLRRSFGAAGQAPKECRGWGAPSPSDWELEERKGGLQTPPLFGGAPIAGATPPTNPKIGVVREQQGAEAQPPAQLDWPECLLEEAYPSDKRSGAVPSASVTGEEAVPTLAATRKRGKPPIFGSIQSRRC